MQELLDLTADDLRTARKQLGMSQRAFAEALGSGRRTVEDWEAAVNKPPRFLRLAIAALIAHLPPWPDVAAPIIWEIRQSGNNQFTCYCFQGDRWLTDAGPFPQYLKALEFMDKQPGLEKIAIDRWRQVCEL